jgi:hypothetical protein
MEYEVLDTINGWWKDTSKERAVVITLGEREAGKTQWIAPFFHVNFPYPLHHYGIDREKVRIVENNKIGEQQVVASPTHQNLNRGIWDLFYNNWQRPEFMRSKEIWSVELYFEVQNKYVTLIDFPGAQFKDPDFGNFINEISSLKNSNNIKAWFFIVLIPVDKEDQVFPLQVFPLSVLRNFKYKEKSVFTYAISKLSAGVKNEEFKYLISQLRGIESLPPLSAMIKLHEVHRYIIKKNLFELIRRDSLIEPAFVTAFNVIDVIDDKEKISITDSKGNTYYGFKEYTINIYGPLFPLFRWITE